MTDNPLVEAVVRVLQAEQDRLHDEDYIMDTNDCIAALRENPDSVVRAIEDAGWKVVKKEEG